MGKRVSEAAHMRAKELYMQGWSLREIAQEVLPNSSGGFVTVHRWAKAEGWREEKEDLQRNQLEEEHKRYLGVVADIKDRHLRIAQKAAEAVELTLEEYIVEGEDGRRRIKLNPRTGLPVIPAVALVQLIAVATDLERKTVGMDQLETEDNEATATQASAIDATLARQIGDWLAEKGLLIDSAEPDESTT